MAVRWLRNGRHVRFIYQSIKTTDYRNEEIFVTAAALLAAFSLGAQTPDKEEVKTPYEFTAVKDIPATSVKDQYSSGTCWSFAGIAFLESELLRTGKGDYDLSEMWIARHAYLDKAKKYTRMHGKAEFSQGGATHDYST